MSGASSRSTALPCLELHDSGRGPGLSSGDYCRASDAAPCYNPSSSCWRWWPGRCCPIRITVRACWGKGGRGRGYPPRHWAEDPESQVWNVVQRRTARHESGLGP